MSKEILEKFNELQSILEKINYDTEKVTVSGRNFLGIQTQYSIWIKRMLEYDFRGFGANRSSDNFGNGKGNFLFHIFESSKTRGYKDAT
jgi:hypothetical protein